MIRPNVKSFGLPVAALMTASLIGGGQFPMNAQAAPQAKSAAMTMQTAPHGKLTPWDAMKIANANIHGKPIEANYGFEGGHWIYDVIIIKDKKLVEIAVNAITGKMDPLENVTPKDEGAETVSDLTSLLAGKAL